MSERGKGYDKMSLSSHPLSLNLFMTLLCFTSMDRLISLAHATNQYRPDDDLVSNSYNLSYIYDFRSLIKAGLTSSLARS